MEKHTGKEWRPPANNHDKLTIYQRANSEVYSPTPVKPSADGSPAEILTATL